MQRINANLSLTQVIYTIFTKPASNKLKIMKIITVVRGFAFTIISVYLQSFKGGTVS